MKKSKIIQKTVKLFLAFVMFLGVLFQNSSLTSAQGTEVDRVNTKITRFEIKNHDGTPAPGYHYWNEYRLDMDWDASSYGNQLKQGDYFIVKLPEQFKFPTDGPTVDFKLYAPDGKTVIANAHVNSNGEQGGGTVKVTFTKYVENRENVKGNLYLQAGFAHSKINEGGDNIIDIQIGSVKKSTNIKIGPKPTIKNETFAKWGATVPGNDNQAKWVLRINHIKGNYSNLTISDRLYVDEGNLPPTIHYIRDSFVLYELEYDQYGYTSRVVNVYKYNDLKDFIKFSGNDTQFTFEYSKKFGDINGRQYRLTYNTTYIPQLKLKNEGIFKSTETNIIYRAWFNNAEAGGTGQGDLIQKIKIFKVDENDRQIKLPNAEFLITKVKDGSTFTLRTDAQGEAVSEKLEPGKYKIKETKAPDGYILDPTEKEVNVVEGEVLFWTATNAKITNIDIAGKKTWDDANNQDGKRPDKIKVILKKTVDGTTTTAVEKEVKADADGNWKYEFNNLPKHENGKLITYSIDEEDVPGYEKSVEGYNLKNTHTPEKVSVAGTKTWDDGNNQDGKRPDKIKVILNKTVDGQTTKVTEKEVTKDNWNYEFNDLPKYENGKEITYSIDEEAVPGYEKEVTGYNLKNSHTPEKVNIQGTKTWDDSNNQDGKRPDKIKVILNKTVDGQTTKVTEKEVTKDNWNYEFNDLPKYENGKEITYSIDEEAVPGYEKEVTGYNLKNSHTPEVVNVQGTKTWDDSNNQDGKRPDKIKVILNKTVDGQTTKVTEKEVTKDNWNYEFNDLPKYENGKEITYSIDEEAVPGYEKEVTGYNLKNSHTPEVVNVQGTKTWDDANNQDGKRPDKIKVILNKTVDGQTTKVTEKEVTKDNWNYEFNDLPKYENGKEITYSIDEEAVPGYEKEVTGYNLKNSHTPEVVNVQGTKTWDDANNQYGKRPDKIKVTLNKTVGGQTTKVTEKEVTKDNWNYEFNDLPKYENGKEITYSIDEEAVPGYEKEVTGYNLKNSYTPEKVSVAGTKTWDDANNQDGKRPDKIKVILNKTVDRQTTKVTEKEVTKDNWNYEFNDLPKYENGKEITYSIDEEAVPGYEKEVTGYNLKNSYTPEKVSVAGTKTWDDANNQDGKRPDKIKVILNKTVDGQTTKVTEKEVTKDNWNYEFNDLPKYENGKEITYSIDEEAVPGYEKEVTGYNLKNSYTPEKVSIAGVKSWDDGNNQDGKRPDKIKVILNKTVDGQTTKVTEKEVTKENNWSYEFNDLPKYENGKEITYSIDEEAVPGYEKSTDGYNLKNTYIPPKPKLPNTGSTSTELGGLGFLAALTGLVLARRKNKTN